MKGDRMSKRSSFGSMVRRRLSDITNSLPQPKSPAFPEKNLQSDNASAKEHIDHLVKEKMALVKLIQEKNKIIELSGTEVQNLRTCLQKMQLQNWTLAQTNSHMLAEVNLGKQRLKALQHDVACKDTLLKTKILQLKEAEEVTEGSEMNEDARPRDASRRRRLSRSASLGSSTTSQQHAEMETALCKRRCVRRESGGGGYEAREEMLENVEAPRTSISRPSRKAVEKVQSYKERPLNIKMRRSQ
ncbi:shugoshin-1-like [Salvia miltiorrhiza]|uniref:shugoshin-1-like n=1 Tax=Salvia miltiorrhiza TaxID=226208 RepID=UPI0025AC0C58|nr:shugoshin-1-like [Salvia miltiorrhiza]